MSLQREITVYDGNYEIVEFIAIMQRLTDKFTIFFFSEQRN